MRHVAFIVLFVPRLRDYSSAVETGIYVCQQAEELPALPSRLDDDSLMQVSRLDLEKNNIAVLGHLTGGLAPSCRYLEMVQDER